MEDETFEVEWGIEAEGKRWRVTSRKFSTKALQAGMLVRPAM